MRDRADENRLSLRLALRALAHSFRFSGRSTRTELASFYIIGTIATMFHVAWSDSWSGSPVSYGLGVLWSAIWSWPLFPLMVRRLHDQGRSGWWASIIGLMILSCLTLYLLPDDPTSSAYVSFPGLRAHHIGSSPIAWLCSGIFVIAILALWVMNLMPGTHGPNAFGSDPRLGQQDPAVLA